MMEIKYYAIDTSIERKIVGDLPQISDVKNGLQREYIEQYNVIKKATSFPSDIPALDRLSLNAAARVTDLVSCSFLNGLMGLLISEKVKEIFDSFKLERARYYDAKIYVGEAVYPYYFLYFLDSTNIVDYPQSKFVVTDYLDMNEKPIQLTSFEDHKKKNEEIEVGNIIKSRSLAIKFHADVFVLPFDANIYVSEKAMLEMIDKNVSGVEFREIQTKFYME